MLALVLIAALAPGPLVIPTATPTNGPNSPLRVIVSVKSSTLCSAVRDVALPIGFVNRRNEDAFSSINRSLYAFLEHNRGTLDVSPSEQYLQRANPELDTGPKMSPLNDISVLTMNKTAFEIAQNVTLESSVMDRSWKEYPPGRDDNIDALRQRLQNMIDLQNGLVNKILSFTQTYIDNEGGADFSDNPTQFATLLKSSLAGQLAAFQEAKTQSDPEVGALASASDVAHRGTAADIVRELALQERAFSSEITKAGTTCGI